LVPELGAVGWPQRRIGSAIGREPFDSSKTCT